MRIWGGGGRSSPYQTLLMPWVLPYFSQWFSTSHRPDIERYIMYTVSIQWGSKAVSHTAWSKSSALAWLYQYPKQDVFGKVSDLFGRTVAVRYYR